ncbi:hypothetical protein [Brevibacillus agri]|uniref:hypothetical protein n=1 Tax=Brevibacillus agri TaxID=51101 RepID=UPI001EE529B8|nr:hypothetical protein [Brevibacillus agri]MCG5252583.1 hypothetical protein [Brevibacillus agri]
MSIFEKIGAEAADSATKDNGSGGSSIFTFNSGMTVKVRVKSPTDVAMYYGYSMFNPRVNTFVPQKSATRNAKGFITSGHTPWDRASDYYYALAKEAKEKGDQAKAEEYSKLGYNFKGKRRYLVGFGHLETGEDIAIDFTQNQYNVVKAAIDKYAKKLDKVAFELTKTGSSTNTVVSLSPILDMDEDLTEAERANFAKCGEKPFDFALFEDCLYVADETEQIKNLVVAGFDIGLLGLTLGAGAPSSGGEITDEDLPQF